MPLRVQNAPAETAIKIPATMSDPFIFVPCIACGITAPCHASRISPQPDVIPDSGTMLLESRRISAGSGASCKVGCFSLSAGDLPLMAACYYVEEYIRHEIKNKSGIKLNPDFLSRSSRPVPGQPAGLRGPSGKSAMPGNAHCSDSASPLSSGDCPAAVSASDRSASG